MTNGESFLSCYEIMIQRLLFAILLALAVSCRADDVRNLSLERPHPAIVIVAGISVGLIALATALLLCWICCMMPINVIIPFVTGAIVTAAFKSPIPAYVGTGLAITALLDNTLRQRDPTLPLAGVSA